MIYLLKVLFPYIVLFYIIDCFVKVKKFHIVFYSNFGIKFKIKKPGIRFVGFSPFCQVYRSINFPFFVGPKGIYLWNKDDISEYDLYELKHFDLLLFDEIKKIEYNDENLIINGSKKLTFSSKVIANHIAKKIETLKKCSPALRRKEHEDYFEKSENLKRMMIRNQPLLFLIQFLGAILSFYVFVILPCFLYLDAPLKFNSIISIIIFFYILIMGLSLYAHNRICKNNEKKYLFLFSILFSPISSIHAVHMITKDITINFDLILQSKYLLSPEDFKKKIIKELKRIYCSKEKCESKDLLSFLLFKEKQYFSLLNDIGVEQDKVFESPYKNDPTAYSYCPFCETDFLKGITKCPDCKIKLSKYGTTRKTKNKKTTQGNAH